MTHFRKSQKELLAKLSITALNEMQEEVVLAIASVANTILLSPTGTGKTVAFLLPTIQGLDPDCEEGTTINIGSIKRAGHTN